MAPSVRFREVEVRLRRVADDSGAVMVDIAGPGFEASARSRVGSSSGWRRLESDVALLADGNVNARDVAGIRGRVWSALLPGRTGEVLASYVAARSAVEGVRLRLAGAADLVDLPWDQGLKPEQVPVSVVRTVEPMPGGSDLGPVTPRSADRGGRIRVVIACGPDLANTPPLRFPEEAQLHDRLATHPRFDVTVVPGRCRLDTLAEALAGPVGEGADVVVLACHGVPGALWLADADGHPVQVAAPELAPILVDAGVRLAVVDACWSARPADGRPGVARALCAAGIPAVIGADFKLEESATGRFIGALAQRLTAVGGVTIDDAVDRGRRAADDGTHGPGFGRPVLYTHPGISELFGDRSTVTTARDRFASPASWGPRPQSLSRTAQSADGFNDVDEPVLRTDLLDHIHDFVASTDRVLLLLGHAGTGKSTFARLLVEADHSHRGTLPIAGWLLRDPVLDSGPPPLTWRRMIEVLALAIEPLVVDWDRLWLSGGFRSGDSTEFRDQLDRLAAPLAALGDPGPVIVVIDALDEADWDGDPTFTARLSAAVHALPPWFRIICTSRPEQPPFHPATRTLELDGKSGADALGRYAMALCERNGVAVNDDTVRSLVEAADGSYLLVREKVHNAYENGAAQITDATLPDDLRQLWKADVARRFDRTDALGHELLAVIGATQPPGLTLGELATVLKRETAEVRRALGPAARYLRFRDGRDGSRRYQLFMSSFADVVLRDDPTVETQTESALAEMLTQPGGVADDPYAHPYVVDHVLRHATRAVERAQPNEFRLVEIKAMCDRLQHLATDANLLGVFYERHGAAALHDALVATGVALQAARRGEETSGSPPGLWIDQPRLDSSLLLDAVRGEAHHLERAGGSRVRLISQLLARAVRLGAQPVREWAAAALDGVQDPNLRLTWSSRPLDHHLLSTLVGHHDGVWALCRVGDRYLASGGADSTIRIWDLEQLGRDPVVLEHQEGGPEGHTGGVSGVCSTGGRRLASAGFDGTVRIWDLDHPDKRKTLPGRSRGYWSLCLVSDHELAAAGHDGNVRIWDLDRADDEPTLLSGHTGRATKVCALGDHRLASASHDGTIRIWDLDHPDDDARPLTGHTGGIWSIRPLGDHQLASAGHDGTIRIWDLDHPDDDARPLTGHTGGIWSICPLHDHQLASAGDDGTIRIWNTDRTDDNALQSLSGHRGPVWGVSVFGDHHAASAGDDGTIRIWDLDRLDEDAKILRGHTGRVWGVSPVGSHHLASVGADGTVRLADLDRLDAEPEVVHRQKGRVLAVCPAGDGHFATAGSDGQIRIWDLDHLDVPIELPSSLAPISGLCEVDRLRVASASDDSVIRIWDLERVGRAPRELTDHRREVFGVCRVGRHHLASAGADRSVRVWDLRDLDAAPRMLAGHVGPVRGVCAVGSRHVASVAADKTVRVWDLDRGVDPCVATIVLEATPLTVAALGGRIVTGDVDGAVMVWEFHQASLERRSSGPPDHR